MTQPHPSLLEYIFSGHFGNIIDGIAATAVFAILVTFGIILGMGLTRMVPPALHHPAVPHPAARNTSVDRHGFRHGLAPARTTSGRSCRP